ncbi:unnamed protein product [Schistocephalus solidus]|uniref:C2H2-type domain-containing protein n=1 Tax=Schistocephalus solidus TaxID=70667 RepID=A0A183TR01_SCHSO|nr:unnamed protein product [Schistocephalus solidus]
MSVNCLFQCKDSIKFDLLAARNFNLLTLSTNIPRANQPCRTSSNIKICHRCLRPHDDDQPTTDNNLIDAPPLTITILLTPPPLPITAMNTTRPTSTTSVAPSDNLPHATSNTTATLSTSDRVSVQTCRNYDLKFPSDLGLVGHLRIHCTEIGE